MEGDRSSRQEVTPASAPAVVQPIQPLADAVGIESVAEAPASGGTWHYGINRPLGLSEMCSLAFSDDQKCLAAAKRVVQHGVDDTIIEHMTRSELIEVGVSEEKGSRCASGVTQVVHEIRDLGGAGGIGVGQGTTGECSAFGG